MNKEAQIVFDKILNKLENEEKLSEHDKSFLKARRSYLSSRQRLKYGDILYLNKQFVYQKIRNLGKFIAKFFREIIIGIIVAIISGLILGYLGKIIGLY